MNTDTADKLADIITSATAWWKPAAEALADGNVGLAAEFAYLGEFGLEGMRETGRPVTRRPRLRTPGPSPAETCEATNGY